MSANIEFSCTGCVFAEHTNGRQNGCRLGRLEKLCPEDILAEGLESDSEEDFSFTFNRFCNTFRPKEWLHIIEGDDVNCVMEEVKPRMGLFVILDTSKGAETISHFKKTMTSAINQSLGKFRYVVVINPDVAFNTEVQEILASSFNFNETEYHLVQILDEEIELHHLDDAFAHAKNGWVYVTTSGEEVASDLIETIHKRINQDMRRMAAVMPYEGINGLIFQSSLYKYLDGFRQVIDEETGEEVPFHFIDRVKALESDDSDSLTSWEDFINDTP